MTKIQIFDPALCCSTGVCGIDVDQQLVDFSADADWAKKNGAQIERFNLAQQPMAFAENAVVKSFLQSSGQEALPLILVDGEAALTGRYPTRDELAVWAGIMDKGSIFTDAVAELVAIGASIAANCEPCFKFHYDQARKLGVADADMRLAVDVAQKVKDAPARAMQDLAHRLLDKAIPASTTADLTGDGPTAKGSCCGPNTGGSTKSASKCC